MIRPLLLLFFILKIGVIFSQDSLINNTVKNIVLKGAVITADSNGIKDSKSKSDTLRGVKFRNTIQNTKSSLSKAFYLTPIKTKEIPQIAFVRSLFLPGWGQITNKQYYKLPLVYIGAGVGGYFLYQNNKKYQDFKTILLDMKRNGETETLIDGRGPFSISVITTAANQYRRWKQGTVIGISVGWLLFAVEANVAAHLKSFDVSSDISFKVKPTILNFAGHSAPGLALNFNFK